MLGAGLLLSPGLIAPRPALAAQNQGQALSPTQQAQEALQAKGLYRGAIDGIAGPETQAAVRQYQMQAGLPVTGQLDARTLAALTGGGPSSAQASPTETSQAGAPLSTREVQRLLQAKGLYKGTIDGIAGPRTDAALRQFQRNNGLNVTGKPDAATLAALAPNQASQAQTATSGSAGPGTASQAAETGSQPQSSGSGGQSSATASQGAASSGQGSAQSAAAPGSPSQGTASSQARTSFQAQETSSPAANAPATQQPAQQAAGASGQVGKSPGIPLPPGGLPPVAVEHLAQAAPAAQQNGTARLPAHGPVLPPSVSAAQLPPSLRKLAQ